jgi:methylated-DNA-protein-cysteine methyltransferase related protein
MASDEAEAFYNAVYAVVRQIPRGQVTTYGEVKGYITNAGHVAKLIHRPRNSRQVGQALKFLQDETVPWQRVVNHKGVISPRDMPGAVDRQRMRLLEEGVAVEDAAIDAQFEGGGGGRVELALFGWFPESVDITG